MKELNRIYNEDCFETMGLIADDKQKVDIILTSPPYNTSKKTMTKKAMDNYDCRYDTFNDFKSADDYIKWTIDLFNAYDSVLNKDGVVLYNLSYASNCTSGNLDSVGMTWLVVADIIRNTNFMVADCIAWKKKQALPNNVNKNKCTRIVEYVFVLCRKDEYKTFNANKEVSSIGKNNQTFYKNIFNFIEAKNNDGICKLNKATYSSDLCKQLLNIYANQDSIVYDPFMGSGTTAIACEELGLTCFGSELSEAQVKFSENRLNEFRQKNNIVV